MPLKSMFYAKIFIRMLCWSIFILQPFCRNSLLECAAQRKNHYGPKTSYIKFLGSRKPSRGLFKSIKICGPKFISFEIMRVFRFLPPYRKEFFSPISRFGSEKRAFFSAWCPRFLVVGVKALLFDSDHAECSNSHTIVGLVRHSRWSGEDGVYQIAITVIMRAL